MDDRERDIADVTALADGTLPHERRPEVERRVASSPELTAALERQRRALDAVHAAAVPAPASLRARLEARPSPKRRRPLVPALGLAGALAAVALLLVLVLPGGGPEAPSVAQAAMLAARGPSAGPPPRHDHAAYLDRGVGGILFPRWQEHFGWRADGVRSDRLAGRDTTTVYYGYEGRRVGYTIVAGAALPEPADWRAETHSGTALRATRLGSRTVVTWRRKGHTCILSGRGLSAQMLFALAAWRAG